MTDQVFIKANPPSVLVKAEGHLPLGGPGPLAQAEMRLSYSAWQELHDQVAMLGDLITQKMTHIQRLEDDVAGLLVERDRMRTKVDNLEKDMAQVATMLGRYTQSIAALRDEADHVEGFIAGHKKVHEERGLTGKWNFRARSPKS